MLTAVAGPRPTRVEEGVLFHWGKHNSHKRAEKAQRGFRAAFELFQGLKEALLPNRHTIAQLLLGDSGMPLIRTVFRGTWTIGQKDERTKHPLTIPLFISTLVGWRLRLIHSG